MKKILDFACFPIYGIIQTILKRSQVCFNFFSIRQNFILRRIKFYVRSFFAVFWIENFIAIVIRIPGLSFYDFEKIAR